MCTSKSKSPCFPTPSCSWFITAVGICLLLSALAMGQVSSGIGPLDEVKTGVLTIQIQGFENDDGEVVANLFRPQDNIEIERSYQQQVGSIKHGKSLLVFENLPEGEYGLIVFHDLDADGRIAHGHFGSKEALGFSGDFRPSFFSRKPDFDDLQFSFTVGLETMEIRVE